MERELPLAGQVLARVDFKHSTYDNDRELTDDAEKANCITSAVLARPPRMYLQGGENCEVGLHCSLCLDGGKPLAFYDAFASPSPYPDVATIDSLAALTDIADRHILSHVHAVGVGMHRPVIDIDLPVKVVPSSTPGHHHLFIDAPMEWATYLNLLDAMAAAGIVEPGYVTATRERGYSTVRLPWVRKGDI